MSMQLETTHASPADAGPAATWQPATKYDYAAAQQDYASLTPAQKARLLLHPPPAIPGPVRAYLDAEAQWYRAHAAWRQGRHVHGQVAAELRKLYRVGHHARVTLQSDAGPITIDDGRAASAARAHARKAPVHMLARVLGHHAPAAGLAPDVVQQAHAFVAAQHALPARVRQRLLRYRRKTARASVRDVTQAQLVQLIRPENAAEQRIWATNVATTKPAGAALVRVRMILEHRGKAARAAATALRQTVRAHEAAVVQWLATRPGLRFDLADGNVRLTQTVSSSQAMNRESLAQSLAEFMFAQGHEAPLAFVQAVTSGVCSAGGGDGQDGATCMDEDGE